MIRITDISDKILENNPDADLNLIEQAYVYSARVHDGQVRLSGEPYLSHPLEVAGILADMNLDAVSIAAGLLHDVIEDTHATEEELQEIFGQEVVNIVLAVTKLSKLKFNSSKARQAESIRRMFLAMSNDIRVILIKLADRLHNMRTLQYHKSDEKKRAISQETLDIYAPIASRLGIYWMKRELEDTAFMYINPEEYEKIKAWVNRDKIQRESYMEEVKSLLRKEMEANQLKCEILGRYKHYYSIYQKMTSQDLSFEDIYDIIAFRIILDTKPKCYEALGLLHAMWKPIDKKFKDYIGRPKPNMYQSLHTTVIGPKGQRIEVQIRTHEMDRVAKSGIAAHWSYKEGRQITETISKQFAWIQSLVENQESIKDPNEFMENVRVDLYQDEVYVFTPQGDIKTLPKGATPVDFAYLIHTEVGNQCVGAKVNSRMVPLKYELQTGDSVNIITSKGSHPSKDWLSFVKTVKARSRIRQWIRIQEKERSLSLGREMCEKEFRKYRLNFNTQLKSGEIDKVIPAFGLQSVEDLIANVGYGKITPLQIIRKIQPKAEAEKDKDGLDGIQTGPKRRRQPRAGVIVNGIDDMLVRFGKCCQPVPGDPIIGYITRGYGITVHKVACVNALKMSPERQIDVEWNEKTNTEYYPVKIRIRARDRARLLADLADNISKNGANILSVNSGVRENEKVDSFFVITVKDTRHLNKIISSIRKVKMVEEVQRVDR